jgi:hypothetical protein
MKVSQLHHILKIIKVDSAKSLTLRAFIVVVVRKARKT